MREILFRAKRVDNGEWVEEYYANCYSSANSDMETRHFIIKYPGEFYEIHTGTICQYTRIRDKNGKKIWESDIVKRTDLRPTTEPSIGIVEYDTMNTAYVIHWLDKPLYSPTYPWRGKIEVIGNVFDNSELLTKQ